MYEDIVLHNPEYDATAMPVENLIEVLKQPCDLVGKLAKVRETGYIGKILCGQKVWGYDENHKYTTVSGVRIEDERTPLGSLPYPLYEIEVLEEELV